MILRVERHSAGRRVFIFDRRLHHAVPGLIAIAGGIIAVWSDWKDRWWTEDTP